MKHILAKVKPYPNLRGPRSRELELDYLRLIYTVSEMRRRGDAAKGYFIIIGDSIPKRMTRWEENYKGKELADLISTLPTGYNVSPVRIEKTVELSGMVTTALLEDNKPETSLAAIRHMEDYILTGTIQELEPGVQRIIDEVRFPLGIFWDFYGVIVEPVR